MSQLELKLYCNGKKVEEFKGDKSYIQEVQDSFGWYKSFRSITGVELADLIRVYVNSIPTEMIEDKSVVSYEFQLKKYRSKKKKFDVTLPWKITKQNNGELVLENWLIGGSIKIGTGK